ncbi:MAG: dihydrolipoamide acetyltransferase family protein [Spirochaetia bacterium]|nr:dihydrolipoamide acetyltransferase family protein [Spirochaetia bacterium]
MAESLLMIALSPTMTEGSIARWKVKENQAFSSGDLLCEVETDKASMDYEAPKNAVMLKILVPEGGKAAVGQPIALIGKAGEKVDDLASKIAAAPSAADAAKTAASTSADQAAGSDSSMSVAAPAGSDAAAAAPPSPAETASESPSGNSDTRSESVSQVPVAPSGFPRSSPLARKLALEFGIDLRLVRGRGPEGRVTEKDVRAYAEAGEMSAESRSLGSKPAEKKSVESRPVGAKRAVIARRLSESFFSAPHYYLRREIRADRLVEARVELSQGRDRPISFNALLIKLVASVLAKHPEMNVYWRGDSIEERKAVDIGLAVALPDGLITPVVRDCDIKGLEEIDTELSSLIEKAKTRGLSPDEYEGAGFTITNLGSFGVDEFTAIINPPGSAILAVGAIKKKPLVGENDEIIAGKTLVLTLGCDHRSIDGATGATFLADLAATTANPIRVIL